MKNFKIPLSLFILLFVSSVCFGQTTKKITTYHDYWKLYPYEVYYVKADQPGFKHGKYKKYYSSGGIRMETNYVNDKQEGKCTFYDEGTGKIYLTQILKNDKRHGIETHYYANGKIDRQGNWVEGKQEGKWIEYKEDGTVLDEITFKNGYPQGEFISVKWPNGNKKSEGMVERDASQKKYKIGLWTHWHENGNKNYEGSWSSSNYSSYSQKMEGVWTYWYENGQMEQQGERFGVAANEFYRGVWTYYHPNGQMMSQGEHGSMYPERDYITKTCKVGYWKFWHDNGQLEMMAFYKGGVPYGDIVMY
ncbi:MAG: hypothetical protein COC01_05180 [Bacteroidetes bacterium]|nr:MAG: hypothetical protein COC01_05180 [Bacteroidota bacterium]